MNDTTTQEHNLLMKNGRVKAELREHVDIEKLCQALIEIAKGIAKDESTKEHEDKS